jgi:DNA-binding transcriptional ArsR family regulator
MSYTIAFRKESIMENISMSRKERKRLEALSRVKSGELSLAEASRQLGLSYRQASRALSRYKIEGDAGLVHRLRGRASNRQPLADRKEAVLELYRVQYSDYGPTLAAECMANDDKISVPVTTLRRWLMGAGLLARRRKRPPHRRRRPRREQRGELVQMDGSHHDWFEGRRAWAVLMVMIDDATNTVTARFYENESWASSSDMFQHYVLQHGLPGALYVDQHGIYRPDHEPSGSELLDKTPVETQFGRAMRELDVELILARSPQAKGRVERMNGTLQDRLVKALRRNKIGDIETANRFLAEGFLPAFNLHFAVKPTHPKNGHRPLSKRMDLACIVSMQEPRTVAKDWTVQWRNRILQLPRETAEIVQSGQLVRVCEQVNGTLRVFTGDRELPWSTTRSAPPPKPRTKTGPTGSSQGQKPAPNHPWRGRGEAKEP